MKLNLILTSVGVILGTMFCVIQHVMMAPSLTFYGMNIWLTLWVLFDLMVSRFICMSGKEAMRLFEETLLPKLWEHS